MSDIKINILGQTLQIAQPKYDNDYYHEISEELTKQIETFLSRMPLRVEMKAVLQVAFKLALENDEYKKKLALYEESADSKLNNCLSKLDEYID